MERGTRQSHSEADNAHASESEQERRAETLALLPIGGLWVEKEEA